MIRHWMGVFGLAWLGATGAGGAWAATLPATQEGLWEVRVQTTTKPANTRRTTLYKECRDHAFDQAAGELWSHVQGCTAQTDALGGDTYSVHTRCESRGTVITTRGTLRYTGTAARRIQNQVTYAPPISGKTGVVTVTDEKYVGACPSTLRPGDRIGSDGTIQRRGG